MEQDAEASLGSNSTTENTFLPSTMLRFSTVQATITRILSPLPGCSHDPDTSSVEIKPTLDPTPGKLLDNVISPIPKTSAKAVVNTRGRQLATILNSPQLIEFQKNKKNTKNKNRCPIQKKTVIKRKKRIQSSDSDSESPVLQESDTSSEEWEEIECVGCGENYFETTKKDEWLKLVLGYLWFVRNFNYWKNKNVLYINPVPFFGNVYKIIACEESLYMFLENVYNQTKKPFFGFFIFNQPYLLVRDPELIKNVLVKDFEYFSNRNILVNKSDKYGSKMLFMLKNPEWKITRNQSSTAFSPGKLKKMIPLIVDISEKLIKDIELIMPKNESLDFYNVSITYAINIILLCGFGIEEQTCNSKFSIAARNLMGSTLSRSIQSAAHFYAQFFVKLFGFKFIDPKSAAIVEQEVLNEVAKRKLTKQLRGDFIDLLIKMKDFDTAELVGLAIQLIVAGFETTGNTISFILYELCLNACIQSRLRNEILTVLENHEDITLEAVQNMNYLEMVVKEGLRKYPTLPFVDRTCTKNYKVANSDLVIEKGTPIYISISALHHDSNYFPNPTKFDPERFSDQNKSNVIPYTYIPFGEGYRNCIGSKLGILAVSIAIIQILKHFKVEMGEDTPRKLKFKSTGMLMVPEGNALIVLGYLWLFRNFNYWKNKNVLYINPVPFFGNAYKIIACEESLYMFLENVYNQTKKPFFGFFIFNQPYLLVRDPELIKNVLVKDFEYFSNRNILVNKSDKYGSKMLFMLKNPEWKITRNQSSTAFSPGKLKKMIPLIVAISEKLIKDIELIMSKNESVDIHNISITYAINFILLCGFGIEEQTCNSEFSIAARNLTGFTLSRTIQSAAHFYAQFCVKLFGFKFIDPKFAAIVEQELLNEVAKRKLTKQLRGDFIDLLIKMKDFDTAALVGLAIQLIVAGFETTGNIVPFILYELCLNASIQSRLRNEILTVLENHEDITLETIQDMNYLEMVVKEGLRKYPTLPFVDRICTKNYKVANSDLVIEKGTPIYISISALHHDSNYFPNPTKFDPERFSDQNKSDVIPYTYIPFGEGYRNCIGSKLGVLAVSIAIIQILKHFKVEMGEGTPRKLTFKSTGMLMVPEGDALSLKFSSCT
ncbi:hypothetical protein FQA39_LY14356 [Lamprigera yunnana]|nr:hypothetical protein FQA39_LY14356 [Lamprigera yunnana]